MLAVALGAIRARRTQAAALLLIAVLVTAAAVAAPFFVLAATSTVALRDVSAAPPAQRVVTAHRELALQGDTAAMDGYRSEIRRDLALPGFDQIGGATVTGELIGRSGGSTSPLAIRDGVCGQVQVQGACPSGTGEAMVSGRTAAVLGVRVGDQVRFSSSTVTGPVTLRITGLYHPRHPDDSFWGTGQLLSAAPPPAQQVNRLAGPPDAVFVTVDTFVATRTIDATVSVDYLARPDALGADNLSTVTRQLGDGSGRLKSDGYLVDTKLPDLIGKVRDDQRLILLGVPLGAGQLVLFGWFALFLAVTMAATARRADLGLLKLRGLARRRIWTLAVAQSGLPALAGVLPGAALGWLLARLVAGGIGGSGQVGLAVALAAGAAAVAVLGGLLAALVAERRTVRTDVVELLRRTPPPRRSGWRGRIAGLVDVALAMLALAGVYQVHTAANGQDAGLVVLAPGLVAFAAGLLLARLLVPTAARAGRYALRAGRVRGALTAIYLARRPGLERLFALLVVAVAVAGYAALAWDTSSAARYRRAAEELGAARVLTLDPVGPSRLLTVVRSADPSGRWAMAAVQAGTGNGVPAVLAVDSTRLAAVAAWSPGYGIDPSRLAALLHPPAPPQVRAAAPGFTLDVTVNSLGTDPVYLVANLTDPDGGRSMLGYGPMLTGTHRYAAASPACARAPGCRLDGFDLTSGFAPGGQPLERPAPGVDLVLTAFAPATAAPATGGTGGTGTGGTGSGTGGTGGTGGSDPGGTGGARGAGDTDGSGAVPADLAGFRDPSRWRPTTDPADAGPVLAGTPDGLRVTLPVSDVLTASTKLDGQIYRVDAPTPVPVLLAGPLRNAGLAGDPQVDLFASTPVPVRIAARAAVLPRLGAAGALVDLDYADRLVDDGGGPVTPQVWLVPGAPSSIVDKLTAAGLRVVDDDSIDARRAQLGEAGPVIALRFELLGAALAVVLSAAGLVLVATVERGPRSEELTALRGQGLSGRAARSVAVGGYAWLAGGALLAGLLVAPLDRWVTGARATLPLFADDWRVLPPPALLRPGGLLVAAAVTAAVLGATVAFAGRQLIRRVAR